VPIPLSSFISSIVPACTSQMFVPDPERVARRVMSPELARYGESKAGLRPFEPEARGDHGHQKSPWCAKGPNSRGDILTRRATALFSDRSVEIVLCRHKLTPKLVCRPPAAASKSPPSCPSTPPAAGPHPPGGQLPMPARRAHRPTSPHSRVRTRRSGYRWETHPTSFSSGVNCKA
jgi:hypothetical protein